MAVAPQANAHRGRLSSWAGPDPTDAALGLARAIGRLSPESQAARIAPIAIVSLNVEGTVRSCNQAAEDLFGWPAAEVIGRPMPFLGSHPLDVPALLTRLELGDDVAPARLAGHHRNGVELDLVVSFSRTQSPADDAPGASVGSALVLFCSNVTGIELSNDALGAEHNRWQLLLQHITETVAIVDRDAGIREIASQEPQVLGRGSDDYAEEPAFGLIHPDDLDRALEAWEHLSAAPGNETHDVLRVRHASGHYNQIEFDCVNLLDDPVIDGIVMTARNVTRLKADETLLAGQAEVLELIARDSPLDETLGSIAQLVDTHTRGSSGILLLRDDARSLEVGTYGNVDPQLLDLLRRTPMTPSPRLDTLDIRRPIVITDIASDVRMAAFAPEVATLGARSSWSVPIVENRTEELLGLIAVFNTEIGTPTEQEREVGAIASHLAAIAIERNRALQQLEHQATHDQVTGLPNRSSLMQALETRLARARDQGRSVALMVIDIDRFKAVNDTFGHAGGDILLVRFGRRLRTLVHGDEFVASLGGDEFVIVLEHDDALTEAQRIGTRIDLALSEPFALDEGEVFTSTSVGVAVSTPADPVDSAETLVQNADAARSRAKELGRDRLEIFDQPLRERAAHRLRTDRELRTALESDQLVLHYQPTIDVASGRVIGAEALLRWEHPRLGLLLPEQFLEIAEGSGTILRIGRKVLDHALDQARRWVDANPALDTFSITVNLSAREVSAPGLAAQVRKALERHSWPADQLVLDLTERTLVEDRDTALRSLEALKRTGVRLAIDDFGTGFSSLSYLHRFPVDMVKIDRSFIAKLNRDGTGSPVVNAVLHMAKALGLVVLAEGVEQAQQIDGLRRLGCELAQGDFLGPAVAPSKFPTGRVLP